MTAGTSNDSRQVTTVISAAAYSAGRASGSVTRRKTVHSDAPLIRADSSRAGSIERNDATISRKTSGERWSASTQIIPGRLYRLNAGSPTFSISHVLRMPLCGSSRKVHAIVCRIPGTINGTIDAA